MSMDIGGPSRDGVAYMMVRTISGTCNALFGLGLVEREGVLSCRSVERCPSRWTAAGRWQMAALSVASERAKVSESRPRMRRHEGLNKKRSSAGDGGWRQTALGSSWCKRRTERLIGSSRLWTVGRCNKLDMSTDDDAHARVASSWSLGRTPLPPAPRATASWYALDASVAQRRCGSLVGAQERQKTNGSGTWNACHGEGGSSGCNFSTPTCKSDGSPVPPAKAQIQSEHTVWSSHPQHCGAWGVGGQNRQLSSRSSSDHHSLLLLRGHGGHRCSQDLPRRVFAIQNITRKDSNKLSLNL